MMKTALALVLLFANAPSAWSQTPDPAKWADLIKKAQSEGQISIVGPPIAGLRTALSTAFSKRYGIQVDYLPINAAETITRVDNETKAGRVSIDAAIAGTSSCWAMAGRGQIEDMNGKLIDPDMLKPDVWRNGQPRLSDAGPTPPGTPADFHCGFQTAEWVMTDLFVNTAIIKPGEITSWKDLLKPQYKGKIASYDPRRSGSATTTVGYLAELFGNQFLSSLYVGQNVRFTTDHRQLAEWVARGESPIGLSLVQFAVEPFRKQGLPLERIFPADGQGSVMGGFSVIMLIKRSPHPNAAQLFANWFGTQEAQTIYETHMMETSLRTDVHGTNVPDYVRPKPGVSYPVDGYSWVHYSTIRGPAVEALLKELQR